MAELDPSKKEEHYVRLDRVEQTQGEQLLQTPILIEQKVQLPSSSWKRTTELYLLSNQSLSLQ